MSVAGWLQLAIRANGCTPSGKSNATGCTVLSCLGLVLWVIMAAMHARVILHVAAAAAAAAAARYAMDDVPRAIEEVCDGVGQLRVASIYSPGQP